MAVGREQGAKASPCILKFLARMVVVLVSSGENEILPLLVPLKKYLENAIFASPGKNPSDAHGQTHAVLGKAILGGWVPMSGMKVPSLVSVLRPLCTPSVIRPERCTYVVVVR